MWKLKRRRIFTTLLVVCMSIIICNSQSENTVLTYKEYLENIIQYHPLAEKANLKLKMGEAELLAARGNLDPVLTSDWNEKNFKDKLYYRQYQTKLRIPTKFGLDVVGGYENTEGAFLSPENSTDKFGLWHAGVEVNVLQGLLVNERKIALDQAKVFQDLAKNEQQILLNELIYTASSAYLLWQQYHSYQEVLTENISIASTYLENTKQSFYSGEKTAMDTLEAFILYQDAISLLQKNGLGLIKSRQNVENYLWYNQTPVTLQVISEPEDYKNQLLQRSLNFETSSLSNHPLILASLNKLSYFEIEQRLKREKLKPKLKVKFNPLLSTSENNIAPNYSIDNYKWGFDFSFPLLLRTERADIQRGEIKIKEIDLDLQNKRNELQNKIESSLQQQTLLQEQINLLTRNVENYRLLLDGETEKFNFGESSVFLLNKRQEKYIDGQLKLIETYLKQQMEILKFLYYSNQLVN